MQRDSPVGASAATAQEVVENEGVEEIVVTAQGRAQQLQDVPIAIVAVSGEALKDTRHRQSAGAPRAACPAAAEEAISTNDIGDWLNYVPTGCKRPAGALDERPATTQFSDSSPSASYQERPLNKIGHMP